MSDGSTGPLPTEASKANQMTSKPGFGLCSGMSLGATRLLPRWCPACRQHESGPGSRREHVKVRLDTDTELVVREGELQAAESVRSRVPLRGALADSSVVAVKSLRIAVGVEPRGGVILADECDQP
jgi:hypothetical protein